MSRIDVDAATVRSVRATLKLTQEEFAARLGVSRRTVIRGEQRGIELGFFGWSPESNPRRAAWKAMRLEAERDSSSRIPEKVSRAKSARAQVSRDTSIDKKSRDTASSSTSSKCHKRGRRP